MMSGSGEARRKVGLFMVFRGKERVMSLSVEYLSGHAVFGKIAWDA
jgi:hypothetical protein